MTTINLPIAPIKERRRALETELRAAIRSDEPTRGQLIACARPYGVPGASLVSWRGLPSGLARR